MGESLVEAPKVENKMGESVTHVPCLQESVSFGRFEHDSLCWERWSTFPTNKYLEEVEKCSTPGSVAQKKAYFEAHYKKIAARKAELLDLEKKRETESVNSEDQTPISSVCNTCEEELDVEKSKTKNSVNGTELENEGDNFAGEVSDDHVDVLSDGADIIDEANELANPTCEVSGHTDELNDGADVIDEANEVQNLTSERSRHIDVQNDSAAIIEENKDMQPGRIDKPNEGADMREDNKDVQPQSEDANENFGPKMENHELEKPDECVLVREYAASTQRLQDKKELPQQKVEETEKLVKRVDPKKIQKATLVKKVNNATNAKKESASPISKTLAALTPKSPTLSAPKSSKPELNKTAKSASPISKRLAALTQKSPTLSTSKSSKPELNKTAKSTIRTSIKKENGSTPVISKKAARPESKRALPTSLHMSLSLEPVNSDPASRKSFIMETMGDKDIVKRAFKAFQNVTQLSPSSLTKPPATNQSLSKKIEQKGCAQDIPRKKNEGIIREAKAASPHTGQLGTRKTSQSPGLKKNVGIYNGRSLPVAFGTRSLDQGSKLKEVSKKLEQNSKTNSIEKTPRQSKVKVEKAREIKRPSHGINSKSKLSSSYDQGRGFLRGSIRKEDAKI